MDAAAAVHLADCKGLKSPSPRRLSHLQVKGVEVVPGTSAVVYTVHGALHVAQGPNGTISVTQEDVGGGRRLLADTTGTVTTTPSSTLVGEAQAAMASCAGMCVPCSTQSQKIACVPVNSCTTCGWLFLASPRRAARLRTPWKLHGMQSMGLG